MNIIHRLKEDPGLYMIYGLGRILRGCVMLDRRYLQILYRYKFGKRLNLEHPQTYSEKLQWLKLYDRQPVYTTMVDKYEAKEYVADIIGKQYIIPTLGVWNRFEEIDFDQLPDQFVLKCTHDSGGLVICRDKSRLDMEAVKKKINHCLKRNYYWNTREWPYKNVKPRIIAEKYMESKEGTEHAGNGLNDYKFFCFGGKVEALFIATDRGVDTRFDFYDADFNHLDFTNGHPNADKPLKKPQGFDEMKRLAELLSRGLAQLRVDFYEIDGTIYFGELTLFHFSGLMPYHPQEWDDKFGGWVKLPEGTTVVK